MASRHAQQTPANLQSSTGPEVAKQRGSNSNGNIAQSAAATGAVGEEAGRALLERLLAEEDEQALAEGLEAEEEEAPAPWAACWPLVLANILNTGAEACGLPRLFTRTSKATKLPGDIHPPSKARDTKTSFPYASRA